MISPIFFMSVITAIMIIAFGELVGVFMICFGANEQFQKIA